MSEEERSDAFRENGYVWPPVGGSQGWPPVAVEESEAYRRSRDRIEAHIRSIDDYKLRWDEFFSLTQTRLMPRFTDVGFRKMRAPPHLFEKLRVAYDEGLKQLAVTESAESFAHKSGGKTPKELLPNFISTHWLNDVVMEVHPLS
jgi:hypothetical protein